MNFAVPLAMIKIVSILLLGSLLACAPKNDSKFKATRRGDSGVSNTQVQLSARQAKKYDGVVLTKLGVDQLVMNITAGKSDVESIIATSKLLPREIVNEGTNYAAPYNYDVKKILEDKKLEVCWLQTGADTVPNQVTLTGEWRLKKKDLKYDSVKDAQVLELAFQLETGAVSDTTAATLSLKCQKGGKVPFTLGEIRKRFHRYKGAIDFDINKTVIDNLKVYSN